MGDTDAILYLAALLGGGIFVTYAVLVSRNFRRNLRYYNALHGVSLACSFMAIITQFNIVISHFSIHTMPNVVPAFGIRGLYRNWRGASCESVTDYASASNGLENNRIFRLWLAALIGLAFSAIFIQFDRIARPTTKNVTFFSAACPHRFRPYSYHFRHFCHFPLSLHFGLLFKGCR